MIEIIWYNVVINLLEYKIEEIRRKFKGILILNLNNNYCNLVVFVFI